MYDISKTLMKFQAIMFTNWENSFKSVESANHQQKEGQPNCNSRSYSLLTPRTQRCNVNWQKLEPQLVLASTQEFILALTYMYDISKTLMKFQATMFTNWENSCKNVELSSHQQNDCDSRSYGSLTPRSRSYFVNWKKWSLYLYT